MREYAWFKYERTEHAMSFINHEICRRPTDQREVILRIIRMWSVRSNERYSRNSEYSWIKKTTCPHVRNNSVLFKRETKLHKTHYHIIHHGLSLEGGENAVLGHSCQGRWRRITRVKFIPHHPHRAPSRFQRMLRTIGSPSKHRTPPARDGVRDTAQAIHAERPSG